MMTWWLAVPLLAVLITLGVLGALGVGSAMMLKRIANPQLPTKPRSRRRDAKWRRGEDLQRYPERLAALERQLEEAWRAASLQARHLKLKRVELEEKGSRAELVERYEKDLASLRERQESIEGVLATVWRTRSSLLLRVHLAVAARQRPELRNAGRRGLRRTAAARWPPRPPGRLGRAPAKPAAPRGESQEL